MVAVLLEVLLNSEEKREEGGERREKRSELEG